MPHPMKYKIKQKINKLWVWVGIRFRFFEHESSRAQMHAEISWKYYWSKR